MDAGRFDIHVAKQGDRTVSVATYGGKGPNTEKLGRLAHQYIQFYEQILGPFPFNEFNIIHQLQYGYGQAPPGTMYITDEAFDSVSTGANQAYSRGVSHRFAHEIAHQYWGIKLKMASYEDQWITESFAEYCSALAIRMTKGLGENRFDAMVGSWKDGANQATKHSSIAEANRLWFNARPLDAMQSRQSLIYDKGALILHRLHQELGDRQFLTMLQTLIRSFEWGFATTIDVRDLAGLLAKKDYKDFFERCYWGTEMP
jgi:aminopeptidase N